QYGYQQLEEALNSGYQEGYLAGRADRADNWRFDYRSSWAYRDANYGYSGLDLDQPQYNYYFRQGFQRGYHAGYHEPFQYGNNEGGTYQLVASLLNTILNLKSLG